MHWQIYIKYYFKEKLNIDFMMSIFRKYKEHSKTGDIYRKVGRKLAHHNNLLSSFIDVIIVCNSMKSETNLEAGKWGGSGSGGGRRCALSLFFAITTGDVSISLAYSKSWVSLLKGFLIFKNLLRFHHQAFVICKNGQSLEMRQCVKK